MASIHLKNCTKNFNTCIVLRLHCFNIGHRINIALRKVFTTADFGDFGHQLRKVIT